jgi:restriction endonuclease S subunit
LVKVPIEEIAENSYSLNYSEYMSKESEKEELNNDIELKTLGEICEFLSKSKRPASYGKDDGKYPFFKSSLKINSYVEENDYDKESLIIGDGGEPNINYGVKFSVSDHCFILQNKDNENVNLKYVYYFIYNNLNIMKTLYKGIGIKNISKSSLQDLQILIPSLEKQNKIVNYLDLIESSNNLSKKKIESLKELNKFYVDGQIEIFSTEKINLGEICEINIGGTPSRKKLEYYENSNYLWASVRELNGGYIFNTKEKINDLGVKNSSVKLFKKDTVLFSFKLSIGKTAIVGTPLYTNEAIAGLFSLDESILNNKYLYHYLTITDFSNLGSGIIGNGSLNKSSLQELKIPVLSLDIQNEIVIYCDDNNSLIKNLEEEIEKNKKQANLYLKNILQIQPLLNSEPQIETETDSQESNSQEAESEASSEAASSSKCEADD